MSRKKPSALLVPLSFLLLASFSAPQPVAVSFDGRAYDDSIPMDFSDSTEAEVDSYYASLPVASVGEDFRKSLYEVLSKDNYFVEYGSGANAGVNRWYKITDRNWSLSRPIDPSTYRFSEDTKDNYYLNLLYFQDNTAEEKAINSYVNSFKVDASIPRVDFANRLKPSGNIQEDKEHIWAKSHGFAPSGDPTPGAGTDLHHLLAADHMTNNLHNNNYYGNVDRNQGVKEVYAYYADGTEEVSGWIGKNHSGDTVFEPTDMYKGDVARALLYMGVRYSNKLVKNTMEEPYLLLTDDANAADDNANFHGVHHNLSDFLAWNELDPVSSYEIHRNNLIYKNVQRNRNPFIDRPDWARRVYDPENYSFGGTNFNKLKPSYNLHVGSPFALPIEISPDRTLNLEYDASTLEVAADKKTVTPLKESKEGTLLKYKEVDEKGDLVEKEVRFVVWEKPALEPSSLPTGVRLAPLASRAFEFNVSNLFDDEKVVLIPADPSIVSAEGTTLKGLKSGSTAVDVVVEGNVSEVIGTFDVTVTVASWFDPEHRVTTIVVIAVVAVVLITLIAILVYAMKRKRGRRRRR